MCIRDRSTWGQFIKQLKMFKPQLGVQLDVLKGANLVVSSMSRRHTENLAFDYLTSVSNFQKIGYYFTNCLEHVVLNLNGRVALGAEFFKQDNTVILILRSDIQHGKRKTFMNELVKFIKANSFLSVLLIGSSTWYQNFDSTKKIDISRDVFYFSNTQNDFFKNSSLTNLVNSDELFEGKFTESKDTPLNHLGIARELMKYATQEGVTINLAFLLGVPGGELLEALFLSEIVNQLYKVGLTLTGDRRETVNRVMQDIKKAPTSWLHYGVSS
eukprot:TRINITY_DN5578_c0_g1_i1.p1 TRINITY_DN5578_c0_g1~~TRINITY_DN5578_c0_g1_i1.p1  ORF type:complete len:271 (-),score=41.17 TRINITY_DN5578_c0_g1_i1:113-925(-)